jgi:hypothetical protein
MAAPSPTVRTSLQLLLLLTTNTLRFRRLNTLHLHLAHSQFIPQLSSYVPSETSSVQMQLANIFFRVQTHLLSALQAILQATVCIVVRQTYWGY